MVVMKQALKHVSTALVVLVMVTAAFAVFAPYLGWRIDVILSGSMSPTLGVGGLVVTRPVSPTDVEAGDIITYCSPIDGKLVTHRVIEIRGSGRLLFQTKGDANEDPDPYAVPSENVGGKVCLYLPLLGYMAHFLKEPLVLLLSIAIPGSVIIVTEMRNIWRVLSEEEMEKKYRIG
jgi:signal peptidase